MSTTALSFFYHAEPHCLSLNHNPHTVFLFTTTTTLSFFSPQQPHFYFFLIATSTLSFLYRNNHTVFLFIITATLCFFSFQQQHCLCFHRTQPHCRCFHYNSHTLVGLEGIHSRASWLAWRVFVLLQPCWLGKYQFLYGKFRHESTIENFTQSSRKGPSPTSDVKTGALAPAGAPQRVDALQMMDVDNMTFVDKALRSWR